MFTSVPPSPPRVSVSPVFAPPLGSQDYRGRAVRERTAIMQRQRRAYHETAEHFLDGYAGVLAEELRLGVNGAAIVRLYGNLRPLLAQFWQRDFLRVRVKMRQHGEDGGEGGAGRVLVTGVGEHGEGAGRQAGAHRGGALDASRQDDIVVAGSHPDEGVPYRHTCRGASAFVPVGGYVSAADIRGGGAP